MTAPLLRAVGEASLSAAVMILAVLVLRLRFQDRTPRRAFCLLWDIVLVRLLVLGALPSPVSIRQWLPELGAKPAAVSQEPVAVYGLAEGTLVMRGELQSFAAEEIAFQPVTQAAPPLDWGMILTAVWLAVALLLAGGFLWSHLRSRKVYAASLPCRERSVLDWLAAHPLYRPVQARVSDRIAAPLTYGVLYPVILLPRGMDWEDQEALACVLSHEHTHIRRFDALRKVFLAAALCLHWFNPVVWAMYVLADRDIELACDEAVLRGGADRERYALALLSMEERRGRWSPSGSHFSRNALEERIKAIMKHKHISFTALIAVLVVMSITTTVFASAAPEEKTTAEPKEDAPVMAYSIREEDEIVIMMNGESGEEMYSDDNGKTWMNQEQYNAKYGSWGYGWQVEWWTYEDYKAWLEQEKKELQSIIGERGYTGSKGWFTWDQQMVDETIALYEDILEKIKGGALYSKTIIDKDGSEVEDVALGSDAPTAMIITSVFDGDSMVQAVPKAVDEAALLEELKAFGIGGNANLMTYNGELVRTFVDGVSVGDEGYSIQYVYTNPDGVVDLHTLRGIIHNPDGSFDMMGNLVGVAARGDKNFDQSLIEAAAFSGGVEATTGEGTTAEGTGVRGRSFEEIFAEYEEYGLTYRPRESGMGALFYQNQPVHSFADLKPDGGAFSYEDPYIEEGLIVYTQYDKSGKLTGLAAEDNTSGPKPLSTPWEDVASGSGSWRSPDLAISASQGGGIQYWFRNDSGEACRVYLMQEGANEPVSWMEVAANSEDQKTYSANTDASSYYLMAEAYVSGGEIKGRARVEQAQTGTVRTEKKALGFDYAAPVQGKLSADFGETNGKMHYGVDIAADKGADVAAFADGTVSETGYNASLGNYVVLDHAGGYNTLYAHCGSIAVTEGTSVAMGEKIAEVGASGMATGPALHFELRSGETYLDPSAYLEWKV